MMHCLRWCHGNRKTSKSKHMRVELINKCSKFLKWNSGERETPPTAQRSPSRNPPVHTHTPRGRAAHNSDPPARNQLLRHQKLANFLFDEFTETGGWALFPNYNSVQQLEGNILKCVEDNPTDILPLVPSLCLSFWGTARGSPQTAFNCIRELQALFISWGLKCSLVWVDWLGWEDNSTSGMLRTSYLWDIMSLFPEKNPW